MATKSTKADRNGGDTDMPECFVLMPISDPEGYQAGHFQGVFEDIFEPACKMAGYRAVRANNVSATHIIQLDILRRLYHSPVALCDVSTRNPNVLFELGFRQAFDKPVVLVQEVGTEPIFDISSLRYTDYHREPLYRDVLADQEKIAKAITETIEEHSTKKGVNSLVRLLGLTEAASIEEAKAGDSDQLLQVIWASLDDLRQDVQAIKRTQSASQRTKWINALKVANALQFGNVLPQVVVQALSHMQQAEEALMATPITPQTVNELQSIYRVLQFDYTHMQNLARRADTSDLHDAYDEVAKRLILLLKRVEVAAAIPHRSPNIAGNTEDVSSDDE